MKATKISCLALLCAVCTSPAIIGHASGTHNAFNNMMKAGREALRKEQWAAAELYFRDAIGWDSRNADAHVGLGMAYLHLAKIERAADQFHAAQRLSPNSGQAEMGLRLTHTPEDLEKELGELAEKVKKQPRNAELRGRYAEELIDRDRFAEAQHEAEEALKLKPKLGEALYVLGRVAMHNGNTEEARKNFLLAIKADKRDDDAWGGLGDIALLAKDYPAAITNYQHASAIVPDERTWHEKMRDTYQTAGNASGAAQQQAIIDKLTKS